jgi:glutaredoxin
MYFTIIAQQGCEYCAKARELLFDHGHSFDYLTLDNKPEVKDFVKAIGFPTVPIIFASKQAKSASSKTEKGYPTLVGTYEDLKSFLAFSSFMKAY